MTATTATVEIVEGAVDSKVRYMDVIVRVGANPTFKHCRLHTTVTRSHYCKMSTTFPISVQENSEDIHRMRISLDAVDMTAELLDENGDVIDSARWDAKLAHVQKRLSNAFDALADIPCLAASIGKTTLECDASDPCDACEARIKAIDVLLDLRQKLNQGNRI